MFVATTLLQYARPGVHHHLVLPPNPFFAQVVLRVGGGWSAKSTMNRKCEKRRPFVVFELSRESENYIARVLSAVTIQTTSMQCS